MDINELEFLTRFNDYIDNLHKDLNRLACIVEDSEGVTDRECTALWSVTHQAELAKELLSGFKRVIDQKYWSEWKKKHPHVHEDYDTHHKDTFF